MVRNLEKFLFLLFLGLTLNETWQKNKRWLYVLIKLAIRSIVIMQFKHSPDEHKPEKMYRVPDLKHSNHCLLLSVPRSRQLLSFVHGQGQIINENIGRNDYN